MERRKIFFLVVAAVLLASLFYGGGFVGKTEERLLDQVATTTQTSVDGSIRAVGNGGDYTIEKVPINEPDNVQAPPLDRSITFSPDVSEEIQVVLTEKISVTTDKLKTDPKNAELWLELGIIRKEVGDYEGARMAWQYAAYLNRYDPVVHANLASLFGYYIKDVGLAEVHYLKTIELEPYAANWYVRAADFYGEVQKDNDKAVAILNEGLKLLPSDPVLSGALDKFK